MDCWNELLTRMAKRPVCGYDPRQSPASEPTAITALALIKYGRRDDALPALDFLVLCQGDDGGVGVREGEPQPQWPTSLAVLAWRASGLQQYEENVRSGVAWMLSMRGKAMPRNEEMGHDTTLVAWPWAAGTHSWIEPTALAVAAFKSAGRSGHARTREAVQMLIDRQLPGGGCNYGNTLCLGQLLRPHVQPTGVALWALAGEHDDHGRITASVRWLARTINAQTTTCSLAWAILGLAAQRAVPKNARSWLENSVDRTLRSDQSPHKLALLAWASAAVGGSHRQSDNVRFGR